MRIFQRDFTKYRWKKQFYLQGWSYSAYFVWQEPIMTQRWQTMVGKEPFSTNWKKRFAVRGFTKASLKTIKKDSTQDENILPAGGRKINDYVMVNTVSIA